MPSRLRLVVALLFLASPASGQDVEPAPLPRPLAPPTMVAPSFVPTVYPYPPIPPRRPRTDSREIWQYFAPQTDGPGRLVPRVILSPAGGYLYYNGERYPWVTNDSLRYMPYVLD